MTEVIAAQLQKIGIKLKIKELTFAGWIALATGPKTYGNLHASLSTGIPDPSSFQAIMLGRRNVVQGEWNMADFDPPVIDTLLSEGLSTLNPAQRLATYDKMLEIVGTDLPYVPLLVQDELGPPM